MINLSISTSYKKLVNSEWFTQPAMAALLYEHIDPEVNDLSILVRNDSFLRKLNKQYFGIDEPTDVLSFPAGDINPETNHTYLGDIIISYPQTEKNASDANKTTQQEIMLLVVHVFHEILKQIHNHPFFDILYQ